MNAQRFSLTALVVLGLALAAGAAWGFMITDEVGPDRASQIINLKGASATGEIAFFSLLRVMPDGTEVPFTIPSGCVFRLIRFYFDFKTTSTGNVNVRLEPFLSPAVNGAPIANGASYGSTNFGSGCPIGPPKAWSPTYIIRAIVPGVGTTIPGDLYVNLSGIMKVPGSPAPIDLLLLD
jgi:hypothetical protein